jgi:hypothetical protein
MNAGYLIDSFATNVLIGINLEPFGFDCVRT